MLEPQITAISGMIEMLLFSIIPRAMRVETNSGQEKVEHFALSMLNHFKNRCRSRRGVLCGGPRMKPTIKKCRRLAAL
jgi:hypothetical protein